MVEVGIKNIRLKIQNSMAVEIKVVILAKVGNEKILRLSRSQTTNFTYLKLEKQAKALRFVKLFYSIEKFYGIIRIHYNKFYVVPD